MRQQRGTKQKPAPRSALALPPIPTDTPRPPLNPLAVRVAAQRELLRLLACEEPGRFILPEPVERFYLTTAEESFCVMLQKGWGAEMIALASNYGCGTMVSALVALARGADISHVVEGKVA